MARREFKPIRGVYEHPIGSGVWWVHYYAGGRRHREKVGRRSDAIDLYRDRKADIRRGRKLPELRDSKPTLSVLIDDALEYARRHVSRFRDYASKAKIVRAELGSRIAAEITPKEIDDWLDRFETAATSNRYKAFLSLVFKQAIFNRKAEMNPARQLRQKKETQGRVRFLDFDEYARLCEVIKRRYPAHLPHFVVSVHAGMRLTEQYTTTWGQVHMDRRVIELTKTKNGSARAVALNDDALEAIKSLKRRRQRATDRVFENRVADLSTRTWFEPCLQEAGIANYVWHSNRHTFCSWLAMRGATLKEIQVAAGHKTIATTAKYAHLSPEHNAGVVDRLAGVSQTPRTQAGQTAIKTATKRNSSARRSDLKSM